MPRKSLSGFLTRAPFIDVQSKNGAAEAYTAAFTTGVDPLLDGAGNPMRLSYTPPVDAWWEVWGNIGIIIKVDAAYHYTYAAIYISPADADGVTSAMQLCTQHSQVQTYEWRSLHRIFKLSAGIAYTARLAITGMSGGSWQHHCSPNNLWIQGKAWPR